MSNLEQLLRAFEYGYMWRALLVGVSVSISSATIGSFLVLKKYAMIGHGLSHVAFAAVAIGLVLNQAPLLFSLPLVVLSSIIILKLNHTARLQGDASIALMAAFALALGTVLVSTSGGFNVDVYSYLFGSILTIRQTDVYFAIGFSVAVVAFLLVYFTQLFSMTFDEDFARITDVKVSRLNMVLAILTGVTVVVGIQAIGTLLISALIIFPIIIAMQFNRSFKGTVGIATVVSIASVVSGLLISFVIDFPSGSTIVLLNSLVFFIIYSLRTILGVR